MARPKKNPNPANEHPTYDSNQHAHLYNQVCSAFLAVKGSFEHLERVYGDYSRFIGENAQQLGLPSLYSWNGLGSLGGYAHTNAPTTSVEPKPEEVRLGRRRKTLRPYKKKDPNAPKRPLTAYFLFLNQAREVIKSDLEDQFGGQISSKQITEEATRRFKELSKAERNEWTNIYKHNMESYKERLKEYNEAHPKMEPSPEGEDEEDDEDANSADADGVEDELEQSSNQAQIAPAATEAGASYEDGEDSNTEEEDGDDDETQNEQKSGYRAQAQQASPPKTKMEPPNLATKQNGMVPKQAASKSTKAQSSQTAVPLSKPAKQTPIPLPSTDSSKANGNAQQDSVPIDPALSAEEPAKEGKRKVDNRDQSPEQPKKKKAKKMKDGVQLSSSVPEASSQTMISSSPKPEGQFEPKAEGKSEGKKKKKKAPKHESQSFQPVDA
ncbi:MAG: high mobility group box 3 [Bathelium mastoideum]|nr:MAG: high mobility group box 3 [Bathelium mastoideum]